MTYREFFEAELAARGIKWCRGCEEYASHKRGFMLNEEKNKGALIVHLESEIATRSTLHRGLHEIGHLVNDEKGLRRFEREQAAEEFATRRMRELGIPVPRRMISMGVRYVRRWKEFGRAVKAGRKAK